MRLFFFFATRVCTQSMKSGEKSDAFEDLLFIRDFITSFL